MAIAESSIAKAAEQVDQDWRAPVRELRDSLFLLVLVASSLSAYVGIGVIAVRLLAGR